MYLKMKILDPACRYYTDLQIYYRYQSKVVRRPDPGESRSV